MQAAERGPGKGQEKSRADQAGGDEDKDYGLGQPCGRQKAADMHKEVWSEIVHEPSALSERWKPSWQAATRRSDHSQTAFF